MTSLLISGKCSILVAVSLVLSTSISFSQVNPLDTRYQGLNIAFSPTYGVFFVIDKDFYFDTTYHIRSIEPHNFTSTYISTIHIPGSHISSISLTRDSLCVYYVNNHTSQRDIFKYHLEGLLSLENDTLVGSKYIVTNYVATSLDLSDSILVRSNSYELIIVGKNIYFADNVLGRKMSFRHNFISKLCSDDHILVCSISRGAYLVAIGSIKRGYSLLVRFDFDNEEVYYSKLLNCNIVEMSVASLTSSLITTRIRTVRTQEPLRRGASSNKVTSRFRMETRRLNIIDRNWTIAR